MNKFFILHAGKPVLYCKTNSQNNGIINATVINGAWTFNLDVKTRRMDFDTPAGHSTIFDCTVLQLYQDRFEYDYNSAIEWAEAYLKKNRILRWVDNIMFTLKEFSIRFTKAKTAFINTWNNQAPITISESELDDDIPF